MLHSCKQPFNHVQPLIIRVINDPSIAFVEKIFFPKRLVIHAYEHAFMPASLCPPSAGSQLCTVSIVLKIQQH